MGGIVCEYNLDEARCCWYYYTLARHPISHRRYLSRHYCGGRYHFTLQCLFLFLCLFLCSAFFSFSYLRFFCIRLFFTLCEIWAARWDNLLYFLRSLLKIYTQVVLVCLQSFLRRSNSLLKCASQPEVAHNFLKSLYFGCSETRCKNRLILLLQ